MAAYSISVPGTNRNLQILSTKSQESILYTKHEENACEHPDFYGRQALGLGRVGGDVVENVDQDQEQRNQQSHSP